MNINEIENRQNDNLYLALSSIDPKSLFLYTVIIIIGLYISQYLLISLTTIFVLIIVFMVCYIIYSKQSIENYATLSKLKLKLELIYPKPEQITVNDSELINYLFSIRQYYLINKSDFIDLISNLDRFIDLYYQLMNNTVIYYHDNLENAIFFANAAKNNLHTIILNLPNDTNLYLKYQDDLSKLELILQKYIDVLIKNKPDLSINNYTKLYQFSEPKQYNYYDEFSIY